MDRKEVETEVNAMKEMTPEEFAEAYFTDDTVIPTEVSDGEVQEIFDHCEDEGSVGDWFNRIHEQFCRENRLESGRDFRTLVNLVGWDENGVTYSAGITAYFKRKADAEKFAKMISGIPGNICTTPSTNFGAQDGFCRATFEMDADGNVRVQDNPEPDRPREFPYVVDFYADVRDRRAKTR